MSPGASIAAADFFDYTRSVDKYETYAQARTEQLRREIERVEDDNKDVVSCCVWVSCFLKGQPCAGFRVHQAKPRRDLS